MRRAGDLINEYLREGKLAANRSEPIGAGAYGTVYASDVPGRVMKQASYADVNNDMEREANMQAIAAEMGIAPRIAGLETFPAGIGNRIEMQDVRTNFEPHEGVRDIYSFSAVTVPKGMDAVRVNQQLGQLALKNMYLEDRHSDNIVYNKMTGRPMQLDFGIASRVEGPSQVAALVDATSEGLEAAGYNADSYRFKVFDLMEGGDVQDAMKVAKQGFAMLQKIKPGNETPNLLNFSRRKAGELDSEIPF